jgi:hypothetical protein
MTLLKNDGTVPDKIELHRIAWPIERLPEGIGLSVLDGLLLILSSLGVVL